MDFRLTADQSALVEAIDKLAAQFEAKPTEFRGFALLGHELDKELEEGQYFDIAQVPELGAICARRWRSSDWRVLPYAAEIALSMLVRPQLPGEWPRPLAVVEQRPSRPLRRGGAHDPGHRGRATSVSRAGRERCRAGRVVVRVPDGTMEGQRRDDAAIAR